MKIFPISMLGTVSKNVVFRNKNINGVDDSLKKREELLDLFTRTNVETVDADEEDRTYDFNIPAGVTKGDIKIIEQEVDGFLLESRFTDLYKNIMRDSLIELCALVTNSLRAHERNCIVAQLKGKPSDVYIRSLRDDSSYK